MNIKISIILLLLFSTYCTNAQETIKTLGEENATSITDSGEIYYKDINQYFDKFIGEWLFEDETIYFKVTFIKKERVPRPPNIFLDRLACEYLLTINGSTIYNTYGTHSNLEEKMANLICGSGVLYFEPNKIRLSYSEPPLNGECRRYAFGNLLLEYIPNVSNPQLVWNRTNEKPYGSTTECPDGTQMDTSEFLIPANMVLTKP